MTAVGFSRQNQMDRVEPFVSDAMSGPIYLPTGGEGLIESVPVRALVRERAVTVVDIDRRTYARATAFEWRHSTSRPDDDR